ncbi:MAG: hypothetical protein JO125_12190 [Chloroflexi bacterium]|nr:hypothetical protein [Ktedonobacteraceae bacterium]MBV8822645.1 hypothetical protein [Ktedonobacteraceae bacterium]MBV9021029.1 hypothetical protein [Ktedonobacteraceae bacterium]MBV9708156.1 hypothetical protein [Chloroflexota bacterium]
MSKLILQRLLLVVGVIALLFVLADIAVSIASTTHGSTPARTIPVTVGPYRLTLNLYKDPANAGYALPFSIAPAQAVDGTLTYSVTSNPYTLVPATPVRATISADPNVHNGIQGAAEITVQGLWDLQINVNGPAGPGVADVFIKATAPPPIPLWLGWLLGFIPFYGLVVFLLMQLMRKRPPTEIETPLAEPVESEDKPSPLPHTIQ